MHEVSVAREIIGIVRDHTIGLRREDVTRVKVRVGKSSGVAPESLQFAFQALATDDSLHQAKLEIDLMPFVVRCFACNLESVNEEGLGICGYCGSTDTGILSGTELEVVTIEIKEEAHEYHHD